MFYKEVLEQRGPVNAFLEDLEAQIFPLGTNHGGALVGSIYVPVCPKKFLIQHCGRN